MKPTSYFEGVIGQERAKTELGFRLDNHHKTKNPFPHLLLTGSKGDGKTHLARKVARNLPDWGDQTRNNKRFLSLNAAAIKSPQMFFEDICSQFADGQTYCTVFIDEAHELNKKIQNALLTVLEPNKNNYTTFEFNGAQFDFDFRRITFIFATTEDDQIIPPLVDRLKQISLEPYDADELAQIIELVIDGTVQFEDGTLERLSKLVRRNARKADEIAKDVMSFGVPVFTKKHLDKLVEKTNLYPMGLTNDEVRVLYTLEECGELSLGQLASRIGRPGKAMQKGLEPYILALGLMEIDGKRRITPKGRDYLKAIK